MHAVVRSPGRSAQKRRNLMSEDFKRRDLLRLTAGRLLDADLGAAETPAFFTKEEFAAIDELMETIIPTDDHSPGAKAAGCDAYVDRQLAESVDRDLKHKWRTGLKSLESQCHAKFDKSIADAT